MINQQIELYRQSIQKLEQARDLFAQATCKDQRVAGQFDDLIAEVQSKIDSLQEGSE